MKRDMDLIRALLLHYEGEDPVDMSVWAKDQILYHTGLLHDAGLLQSSITRLVRRRVKQTGDLKEFHESEQIPTQLTWEGHEFLDKSRSDEIWAKARSNVKENVVSIGFNLMSSLLDATIKTKLGI